MAALSPSARSYIGQGTGVGATLTLEQAQATEALYYANSLTRMAAVLQLHQRMARPDWLRLLGDNWSICDGLYRHQSELRRLLGERGPLAEMMTPDEFARWQALPTEVTVYRGASRRYAQGMSWSLERHVAARFPFLNRYRVDDPGLFVAKVTKDSILALKGDREEEEAIIFNARVVEVTPLLAQD